MSGLTALSYEVIWQRLLVRSVGNTLTSTALILCIFLGGLSVGAFCSRDFLARNQKPLRTYALVEFIIAAFALFMPFAFSEQCSDAVFTSLLAIAQQLINPGAAALVAANLQAIFLFILLTLPCLLMGTTINCAARFCEITEEDLPGRRISLLYSWNLAGGALGTVLCGFLLIPSLGLAISNMLVALFNVVAFILLMFANASAPVPETNEITVLSSIFLGVEETLEILSRAPIEQPAPQRSRELVQATDKQTNPANTIESSEDRSEHPSADRATPADPPANAIRGSSGVKSKTTIWGLNLPIICCLVFVTSTIFMMLEVAWTRLLILVVGSSTYALTCALFAVLSGCALAAWFVNKLTQHVSSFAPQIAFSLAALSLTICLFVVPFTPWAFLRCQQTLTEFGCSSFSSFVLSRLTIAFAIIFPSSFAISIVFPLVLRSVPDGLPDSPSQQVILSKQASGRPSPCQSIAAPFSTMIGMIMGLSFAGSICGTLLAAFAVIPNPPYAIFGWGTKSGVESTLVVACLSCLALGLGLGIANKRIIPGAICLLPAVLLLLRPGWDVHVLAAGAGYLQLPKNIHPTYETFVNSLKGELTGSSLLYYKEGANTTVTVEENRRRNVRFLKTDGKVEAAIPIDWQRPSNTSDLSSHLLLSVLPEIFRHDQTRTSNDSLLIGQGAGITSGALTSLAAKPLNLDVVEIEPAVMEASKFFPGLSFYAAAKSGPGSSGSAASGGVRVVTHLDDARSVLRRSNRLYDAIISQPSEPGISGASDLFTKEFWLLAGKHLRRGGVMIQWIQLYSIDTTIFRCLVRSFSSSFDATYLVHLRNAGEIVLVGMTDKSTALSLDLPGLNRDLIVAIQPLNAKLGSTRGRYGSIFLRCDTLLFPEQTSNLADNAAINTDDRIFTEFTLPKDIGVGDQSVTDNLQLIRAASSRNQ